MYASCAAAEEVGEISSAAKTRALKSARDKRQCSDRTKRTKRFLTPGRNVYRLIESVATGEGRKRRF